MCGYVRTNIYVCVLEEKSHFIDLPNLGSNLASSANFLPLSLLPHYLPVWPWGSRAL